MSNHVNTEGQEVVFYSAQRELQKEKRGVEKGRKK